MDQNLGRDRRNAQRVSHRGEVECWVGSVHFSAHFTDISTQGMYIETLNPADRDTRWRVRFALPGHKGMIEAEGVVI